MFNSGIRPAIDEHLAELAAKKRDYGNYWSASSAGYCMRKLIFERLGVPAIEKEDDARKQRVFEAGHIFHEWVQRITKNSGVSILQEYELQDEELMVRGHFDDLVSINDHLILYDIKTQHSNAFSWQKGRPVSHFHRMQVGTYLYMLRKLQSESVKPVELDDLPLVSEARILKISKDDLRMDEVQVLWTPGLEKDVVGYWSTLNGYWNARKIPACTCDKYENGFMAKEKFNPYFWDGEPCSLKYYQLFKDGKLDG